MKKIYILLLIVIIVQSHSGQNIVTSLKDKSGNLWFSVSERNIYRYDGKSFSKFTGQVDGTVSITSCLYEDRSGKLWFKTSDGGVCTYDGKSFSKFIIPLPDVNIVGQKKFRVLALNPIEVGNMLQDKKGNFWFLTTNHGVYRYNAGSADSATHEKLFKQFFVGASVTPWPVCIAENTKGDIIVGCWDGSGVHYYDGNKFTALSGFSDGMIACVTEDNAGNFWFGTRVAGVDRWDGNIQQDGSVKVTNFQPFSTKGGTTNSSLDIFKDSKGQMWFGTNWNNFGQRGDAFVYDGKTFTNITENERIIKFADFQARSFVEDQNGNFWIGSKTGILLHYDGQKFTDFSQQLTR